MRVELCRPISTAPLERPRVTPPGLMQNLSQSSSLLVPFSTNTEAVFWNKPLGDSSAHYVGTLAESWHSGLGQIRFEARYRPCKVIKPPRQCFYRCCGRKCPLTALLVEVFADREKKTTEPVPKDTIVCCSASSLPPFMLKSSGPLNWLTGFRFESWILQ